MTKTKILAALAVAVALIVAGCGESSSKTSGGSSAAVGNGADRAFVADMVPHHQSAVQMARIAQDRGQSAYVKQLASNIITTQTEEIATLRGEGGGLTAAGIKKGSLGVPAHMMGMSGDIAMLKTASPFDAAFMNMMIPHHQGAIVMAKAELRKGQNPQLRTLAQNIITAQQGEIAGMRKHLGTDASTTKMKTMSHS